MKTWKKFLKRSNNSWKTDFFFPRKSQLYWPSSDITAEMFCFVCNISNTRNSVSLGHPNTEMRVENTTHSGAFLTKFEVFG